jgi:hypothetical protein
VIEFSDSGTLPGTDRVFDARGSDLADDLCR